MITFRPATHDDINTLLEFEQGVISAERPFAPHLKSGTINYYDLPTLIDNPNTAIIVAEVVVDMDTNYSDSTGSGAPMAKEIVACGYADIRTAKPYYTHSKYAYLGFMYVVPSHRGQGINKQLIEVLIQWAKTQDIKEMVLDVFDQNDAAINAYKKIGFEKSLVEMRVEI